MEVQILSREIIKPAKKLALDDDDDHKTFPISVIDILAPDSYTPITFFYSMKNQTDSHNSTPRLKLSLSETLAVFPMLAGRLKDNLIHYCSNEDDDDDDNVGALFVEAKVKMISMADFLKTPNLQLLAKFLPFSLMPNEPLEKPVQIAVQVNFFSCGGIAIGLSFLHKIIDGTTMSAFVTSWAASCEGILKDKKLVCGGNFSLGASLFPSREIWDGYGVFSLETPFVMKQGKSTNRRFVFDAVAISNLKAKAKSATVPNPTSVEAVSCFIWKYSMKASRSRSSGVTITENKELVSSDQETSLIDPKWGSLLVHVVNMRRRIQPPLSKNEVGNIYWRSPTYYEASNTEIELANLESILRQSLSKIDNDFIQKAIGEDGFETFLNSLEQLHELYAKSSETFLFSSWRNMGFNEVNFGWGKPIWISCGGDIGNSMVRNIIVLMDTTTGEGMEAWILLDDETMNLLENDFEFLEFASLNPSIKVA